MPGTKFTPKQKNEILKKVERKTTHHYEEMQHAQEQQSAEVMLKEESKTL